ncbi:MAG: F-box-like domain-containing protein [Gammaproteobacteria bacterium]|jgi:alpha-tubulin suppressor-like RCC1 family protein
MLAKANFLGALAHYTKKYYTKNIKKNVPLDKSQNKLQSRKLAEIEKLPLELLMEIVLFLKAPSSDIAHFALVCKLFNQAFKHEYVWQQFSRRNFPEEFKKYKDKSAHKKLSWNTWFKENYMDSKIKSSCGSNHTVFLVRLKSGKIKAFGCGDNSFGQLGFGNQKKVKTPQEIKGFPKSSRILNLSCDDYYTVFLIQLENSEIKAFGCGDNLLGQLRFGNQDKIKTPQEIKGFPKNSRILNFSCGSNHIVFLVRLETSEIKAFGCGNNSCGQLGFGNQEKVKTPQEIKGFPKSSKILNISCGYDHTVFLVQLKSGEIKVFGCGDNFFSQLGLNTLGFDTIASAKTPQEIKGFPKNSRILNFSCGDKHTVFLVRLKSGEIKAFGCGYNSCSQLGCNKEKYVTTPQEIKDFPKNSSILNFSCGDKHTVFSVRLKSGEIKVFGCGYNSCSQLGCNKEKYVTTPQEIKGFPKNSSILNFSCGNDHTVFSVRLKSGEIKVFGCGENVYNQLGCNKEKYVTTPQEIMNLTYKHKPQSKKIKTCCVQ